MLKYRQTKIVITLLTLFGIGISGSVYAADETMIKEGEQLYNQNCVFCHQADAIGKPGFAPSLTNKELLSVASDKFFEATIRDGRLGTGMPPFAHLGRSKVQAIVAYLRSHSELPDRSTEVDAQPEAYGDPRFGKQWYDYICSTCHGVNGGWLCCWRYRHCHWQGGLPVQGVRRIYPCHNQGRSFQYTHAGIQRCRRSCKPE